MKKLLREFHRRSVWQVFSVYLALSWGVLQVVDQITESAGLPDWTPAFALVLLLLGLPVVLATAIVQKGAPSLGDFTGDDDREDPGERSGAAGEAGVPGRTEGVPGSTAGVTGGADRGAGGWASPGGRLLTWRNATLGGVAAFSLLAVVVVAYLFMWSTGVGPVGSLVAQGVIEEGDRLVLADFADRTGGGLAQVVTEALRVDLQESAVITLVPPAQVAEAMARMGAPDSAAVTPDRAREVAIRDGLKAVIQGEVGQVGSGYLLTATVVEPSRGEVLASFRANASDDDELLGALEKLSQDIREKAGESLRMIRAGGALAQVTTSSLEALRLYASAVELANVGEELEAIPLLEEALRLDPDFAMAHRKLSAVLGNLGLEPDRMRAAATRAYELRDRLTDREWGLAEAYYLIRVENSPERAIEAWERVLDRYPDELSAMNNIAAAALMAGRPQQAVDVLRRQEKIDPDFSALERLNLTLALWRTGDREGARAEFRGLEEALPESRQVDEVGPLILGADRQWEEALQLLNRRLASQSGSPSVDIAARLDQAGTLVALGRVQEGQRAMELAARAAVEHRQWEWYWSQVAVMRVHSAWALHHPDPGPARAALQAALADVPLDSLELRGSGAQQAGALMGLVGWTTEADGLRGRVDASFAPEEKGRTFQRDRQRHLLFRAIGADETDDAVDALARLEELEPCPGICPIQALRGLVLERAGRTAEAMEAYAAAVETAPLYQVSYEASFIPLAHQRLADLQAEAGDLEGAAATLQALADAYGAAEEPIASRVRVARARLADVE